MARVVLAFFSGVVRSFEIPTRQAFIPDIVAAEDLANAIGMNSALFNGARLIGPAIAGALIPFVGEGWCFIANAVSYLAILFALVAMKLPRPATRRTVTTSVFADILEGLAHVRRDPALKAILGGLPLRRGRHAVFGAAALVRQPSARRRTAHVLVAPGGGRLRRHGRPPSRWRCARGSPGSSAGWWSPAPRSACCCSRSRAPPRCRWRW